jgi:hypothetical protein
LPVRFQQEQKSLAWYGRICVRKIMEGFSLNEATKKRGEPRKPPRDGEMW